MRRWDGLSRLDGGLPGRLRRGRGFGPCLGKQARPWRRRFLRWEHWDRRDADNRDQSFRCPGVEGLRRRHGERSRANYRHREFRRNRCGNQIWWRRSQCHAVPRSRNGRVVPHSCTGRRLPRCRESCRRVPDSGEELAEIPFRRRVRRPWTFPCSRGLVRRLAVLLFPIFAVPCFLPIVGSSLRCNGRDERYMGSRWMKAEAKGSMVHILPRWGAAVPACGRRAAPLRLGGYGGGGLQDWPWDNVLSESTGMEKISSHFVGEGEGALVFAGTNCF